MGFFDKIKAGLAKTRAALSNTLDEVFTGYQTLLKQRHPASFQAQ